MVLGVPIFKHIMVIIVSCRFHAVSLLIVFKFLHTFVQVKVLGLVPEQIM